MALKITKRHVVIGFSDPTIPHRPFYGTDRAIKEAVAYWNSILQVRNSGILEDKAFWLNSHFNWILAKDDEDCLCLIPRKKGR